MRKTTLIIGALGLMLVACGSKLNQANFEKIQEGMSPKEVKAVLGNPVQSEASTIPILGNQITQYTYRDAKGEVVIVFRDDKVVSRKGNFSNK